MPGVDHEHSDLQHHRLLADPSRRRLLDLLRTQGQADVEALATATGLHVTTVRSHLSKLIAAGLATTAGSAHSGRGRPRILYTATAATDDDGGYRWLAGALVDGLAALNSGPDVAEAAGLDWGRRLAQQRTGEPASGTTPSLVAVLDRLGFAPRQTSNGEVSLHQCPLLELARNRPEIVCRLHLGVLRGALERGDVTISELAPFFTPTTCVVRTSPVRMD